MYADAVWDYNPTQDGDLKFEANDVIELMDMTNDDWWLGYFNGSSGWFPATYVRVRVVSIIYQVHTMMHICDPICKIPEHSHKLGH